MSETAVDLVIAPRWMKDVPMDERPRERLAQHGAGALSNRELLALVLSNGTRRFPVLDMADRLTGMGLRDLSLWSLVELEQYLGIGRARAGRVLAALELGARVSTEDRAPGARQQFRSSNALGRYLLPRYGARPVETFGVLLLDVRKRLRRETVVSVGCLTSSLVHPREVFKEAIAGRAAYLVLFHNHPSGDPEPSSDDVSLTQRLVSAGVLMGIEVLDHLVLGAGRFVSLRERGLL